MLGRAPKAIITDQCRAMAIAIEEIFPNSHHRLCLWHIMKKLPAKLGGHAQYKLIKKQLKNIVYNSLTIDECDANWMKMIEVFNLENNDWLKSLYEQRNRWIPVYVKDKFWAGMSTSQRSESMNAFFDEYVHSKTSLKQFVEQFDNALKKKIEKEKKFGFWSFILRQPANQQHNDDDSNHSILSVLRNQELVTREAFGVAIDSSSGLSGAKKAVYMMLVSCMAVARDIQGKKNRVVTIISNLTTMAGQVYEAMSNAGYLDSNMITLIFDDLVCVLNEVELLDSTGPVLVHVITEDEKDSESTEEGTPKSFSLVPDRMSIKSSLRTFNDVLVEALVAEAERDKSIVVVHSGTGLDPSIKFNYKIF
ncbi:hypothetical protein ZIOFF_069574 [Zingiber officinale]|uniref:Protein FAR1-RELATED SEQUENCE n=1 Tax=Zingiber officinale TaxID=94328 RepID=A0A8J5ECU9_ZINOF|nr:hypothetical protein ZIOFF_069574 [Zingiber officinale]